MTSSYRYWQPVFWRVPIYISTAVFKSSSCIISLLTLEMVSLFFSFVMVSLCGFYFPGWLTKLSIFSNVYWSHIHHLSWGACLSLLPIFLVGCFSLIHLLDLTYSGFKSASSYQCYKYLLPCGCFAHLIRSFHVV